MKRSTWKWLAPVSLIALAACSEAEQAAGNAEVASAEVDLAAASTDESTTAAAEAASDTGLAQLGERPDIPVTLPKMAYVLDYGFRLAGDAIAPLQQKHADMCEGLGAYNCQIVSLSRTGEDEAEITGQLQLAVVANKARSFATLLTAAAEADGAEAFRADIQGEDLSKSIVDTEARVRSRIALRDRLMQVLETRRGTVQELVEAERNVAAVNEEIDQAQSWLKEQKGRVAYSRMTITYESATPGGSFLAPIESVVGSLGSILGVMVAGLILLLAVAGPVVLGALGVRALRRRATNEAAA